MIKVWVLCKTDDDDRTEILGVFATLEVAQTIAEAEEPDRQFHWDDTFGNWRASSFHMTDPIYNYSIEEFEVREK